MSAVSWSSLPAHRQSTAGCCRGDRLLSLRLTVQSSDIVCGLRYYSRAEKHDPVRRTGKLRGTSILVEEKQAKSGPECPVFEKISWDQ
jgi:hypothetical protein